MREIKFRAWDKNKKAFVNPRLIGIRLDGEAIAPDSTWLNCDLADLKLMQYTGLTDKNGKEIYEGDIVTISEFEDMDTGDETIHKIEYFGDRDYPAFDLEPSLDVDSNGLSHCMATCHIEVIGNIYENPELLK